MLSGRTFGDSCSGGGRCGVDACRADGNATVAGLGVDLGVLKMIEIGWAGSEWNGFNCGERRVYFSGALAHTAGPMDNQLFAVIVHRGIKTISGSLVWDSRCNLMRLLKFGSLT